MLLLPAYAFPLGLSGHLIYFGVILLYLNFPYRASTTLAAMAPVVWFHSIFDMVPADFVVLRVWSVLTFFAYMPAKTVSLLQFSCSFYNPYVLVPSSLLQRLGFWFLKVVDMVPPTFCYACRSITCALGLLTT